MVSRSRCGAVGESVTLLSSRWWWKIVVRLERHRQTAAELAVTQERLRFASDLHDILGHHLQVISLKSELAARLMEPDIEVVADAANGVEAVALALETRPQRGSCRRRRPRRISRT